MRGASKLLLVFAIAALLAAGLSACGGGDDSSSTSASTAADHDVGVPSAEAAAEQARKAKQEGQSSAEGSSAGSSKGGSSSSGAEGSRGLSGDTSASFTPTHHNDSGGGAAPFRQPGDSSIQDSGSEASSSDLTEAAAALHGYLDARAADAWEAACSYMVSGVAESFSQLGGSSGSGASCPELLASMPITDRQGFAQADVGSLRVDGDHGFLLFHGSGNVDYFMPMVNEDGQWKVGALSPSAMP